MCSDRPATSGRVGVDGVAKGEMSMSSLEVLRDASRIRGEGDSLGAVPPPSDMDLVLMMGDLPSWAAAEDSVPSESRRSAPPSIAAGTCSEYDVGLQGFR